MNGYKDIDPFKFKEKPFQKLANEWMLITAGKQDSFNTMTAAWGGYGVLWSEPVIYTFIRPTRYTYEFVEREEHFTISFFNKNWRDALNLLGTVSGRDRNKVKEAGLTPLVIEPDEIAFCEAELIIVCRKIYYQDIKPENFLNPEIVRHYNANDYHRMYVGNVEKILSREE